MIESKTSVMVGHLPQRQNVDIFKNQVSEFLFDHWASLDSVLFFDLWSLLFFVVFFFYNSNFVICKISSI